MTPARVAVIGAGIAGASCAAVLRSAGVDVEVLDRGRAPGGRLAAPTMHGRRVDLGAAYFTVSDDEFAAVVDGWAERGVARPWTDTLDAFGARGRQSKTGSMRWASASGLRSLARDVFERAGVVPLLERPVSSPTELDHDAVVLAMPDPQAARLAPDACEWVDYDPVIAVALGFPARAWPIANAAFVNDNPDITLIADDGARRGDGAAVLVIHTTSELARAHLEAPDDVVPTVHAALTRVFGLDVEPLWTHTHRWTFAKPSGTHGEDAYGLVEHDGRPLGVCGDSWCSSGSPRVESAWLSGRRLGARLVERLA